MQQEQKTNRRLDSWKEIAAFFGRDERTVRRWEKERGLPVRRVPGSSRGGVFAYADELRTWLAGRQGELEGGELGGSLEDERPASDESALDEPLETAFGGSANFSRVDAPKTGAHAPAFPRKSGAARRIVWTIGGLAVLAAFAAAIFITSRRTVQSRGLTSDSSVGHGGSGSAADSNWRGPRTDVLPLPARSANPEAQALYLQGRYYWNQRTPDGLNKAVDYFTQSIVKDPNYAPAYVGLADSYDLLREYSLMPSSEAYTRALAAAKRAVALDDNLAEAHATLGFVSFYGMFDTPGAEREFKRAIQLNPRYVPAHHWYATFLQTVGRSPEARSEIQQAQEMDPASSAILADKGLILYNDGHTEEAISILKQVETSDPSFLSPHVYLSGIYLDTGDYSNYFIEARMVAQMLHSEPGLAVVDAAQKGFAVGGKQGLLEAMLQAQKKFYERGQISAVEVAITYARLGRRQEALDYLKIAYEKHEEALAGIRSSIVLREALRDTPPYRDLLVKLGLEPLA
jgi:tetratricopeptide (TPR) repeat protein